MVLSVWFLYQSDHRVLFFNRWVFSLFSGFPKTTGPVLQLNTIGALLAVVIPPLFVFFFIKTYSNVLIITLSFGFSYGNPVFKRQRGRLDIICHELSLILVCWRRWLIWVLVP